MANGNKKTQNKKDMRGEKINRKLFRSIVSIANVGKFNYIKQTEAYQ